MQLLNKIILLTVNTCLCINSVLLQEITFEISCVEVGDVKRAVIGHHGTGRGQGWFCDTIRVKSSHSNKEAILPCGR